MAKALLLQYSESLCNMLHLQCSSPEVSERAKNSGIWQLLSTSSANNGPFTSCPITAAVTLLCAGMDKANLNSYTSGNLSHFSETFCVSPLISIAPPIFTSLILGLVTWLTFVNNCNSHGRVVAIGNLECTLSMRWPYLASIITVQSWKKRNIWIHLLSPPHSTTLTQSHDIVLSSWSVTCVVLQSWWSHYLRVTIIYWILPPNNFCIFRHFMKLWVFHGNWYRPGRLWAVILRCILTFLPKSLKINR